MSPGLPEVGSSVVADTMHVSLPFQVEFRQLPNVSSPHSRAGRAGSRDRGQGRD